MRQMSFESTDGSFLQRAVLLGYGVPGVPAAENSKQRFLPESVSPERGASVSLSQCVSDTDDQV